MQEKILAEMKKIGKPVRPSDIAKTLGVESKDVSKVITDMKKKGLVHSPKRCFYAPGEDR